MLGNHTAQVPLLLSSPSPPHTHTPETLFILWGLSLEKLPSGGKGQELQSLPNPTPEVHPPSGLRPRPCPWGHRHPERVCQAVRSVLSPRAQSWGPQANAEGLRGRRVSTLYPLLTPVVLP